MQATICLKLLALDPNSWCGRFFLQVVAVVVGGVLLLAVGGVLRFIGIPLKWWWRNRILNKLIRKRREFMAASPPVSTMGGVAAFVGIVVFIVGRFK